jgi:hypothetical protein
VTVTVPRATRSLDELSRHHRKIARVLFEGRSVMLVRRRLGRAATI